MNNLGAFFLTSAVCLAWVETCNFIARQKLVGPATSRKMIHIGSGLQYMLLWHTFDDTLEGRLLCGSVPLIAALRYAVVGLGVVADERLIKSTSRTGTRSDLLKGPVVYGVVHGLAAILFWKSSPVGIVVLAFLCAGDGLAEIVGTRIGSSNPLPHNPKKSVVGSLACLGGGFLTALVYLEFFRWSGSLQMPGGMPVAKLLLISVVGTVIESFPIEDWDNLTVSVTVALTSRLLLAQMYKSGLRNGGG